MGNIKPSMFSEIKKTRQAPMKIVNNNNLMYMVF